MKKEFFDAVTGFYKDYGVGMFGLNKAFRIDDTPQGSFTFRAINNRIPLCWTIWSDMRFRKRSW